MRTSAFAIDTEVSCSPLSTDLRHETSSRKDTLMNPYRTKSIGAIGLALAAITTSVVVLAQQTPPARQASDEVQRGYIAAPPGSQTLNTAMDPTSMQLFSSADFKGTQATLLGKGTSIPAGQPRELPEGLPDTLSSIRWNLPHGIVVVFYEDAAMKGEQMVLWGSGQQSDLHTWDFNDKASRWAWFGVGGGDPSAQNEAAMLAPHGSEALATAVPDNTIQLFKDHKFASDMQQINPVTAVKGGELQKMSGKLDDSLTSLRWNLPEGVIVMLYEDADGKKDRVAIWGKGQLSDLNLWDFNDKVSRWSWAYIGSPEKSN
jgi:hypothetical protein